MLHPKVTIRETCILGDRVVIQSGAVIGSCGFGYHTDEKGHHIALEQLGCVVLEDDVEIGANTTIDRARLKETRIGRGTKVDNLVQIAHQVIMGEDCLVVSQTGIAGSTKVGNHCVFGGQVGIIGHLTIGSKVMLAARSATAKSILEPGIYSGAPAIPIKEHNEWLVLTRNIKSLVQRVKSLESKEKSLQ
jgi:UDP-3-O-[3-hydroxymyristoyl] glucosamine N-acyltransferase